jgi:hypothetical protein
METQKQMPLFRLSQRDESLARHFSTGKPCPIRLAHRAEITGIAFDSGLNACFHRCLMLRRAAANSGVHFFQLHPGAVCVTVGVSIGQGHAKAGDVLV